MAERLGVTKYDGDLHHGDTSALVPLAMALTSDEAAKWRVEGEYVNVAFAWMPVEKRSATAFQNLVEQPKRHSRTLRACGRCPLARPCLLRKSQIKQGTAKSITNNNK